MRGYYRIKHVADTAPTSRRAPGGRPDTSIDVGGVRTRLRHDEAPVSRVCFSDDIVVDFPSLQEAVARIRASFLGS